MVGASNGQVIRKYGKLHLISIQFVLVSEDTLNLIVIYTGPVLTAVLLHLSHERKLYDEKT